MQQGQEVGLALAEGKKDDPPRSRFPWKKTTEDRQDDAEADCQPWQGVDQVSRIVRLLLSQPPRVRLVQNLYPGIALEFATQERRGHRLGVWQTATHSTTFRGIDQVGRTPCAGRQSAVGRPRAR